MAKLNNATGVPPQEELYQRGAGGWVYDHTAGPVIDWAAGHKLITTAVVTAAAGAMALGTLLSVGGPARDTGRIQPVPTAGQNGSSQNTVQTASEIYYNQARASLLQDVPDLANYQSALDYTAQRIVDLNRAYGLPLDEVRAPITKWVQANIEWDKKGERLVPLSENPDFISIRLLDGNLNYDKTTRQNNYDIIAPANSKNTKIPYDQVMINNIAGIMAGHDQIWAELHDPAKLEEYLNEADIGGIWWTEQEAVKYKSAIRQHGTFEDKAHWALVGKAYARPMGNEELTRNEQPLAYILAVGGEAQIAHNIAVKELPEPLGTDPRSKYVERGDRQLSFKISQQLENEITSNPRYYGQPIDHGYLQPDLPNRQAVDGLAEASKRDPKSNGDTQLMFVYLDWPRVVDKTHNIRFLVGDEQLAKKIGLIY